jgi:glycosyltransferase involved in cell wall biosynthesis
MIVKDEEANLKRCLDSFLPIIHEKWCELIIVDTGSMDRTLEVAREYTDKVFEKTFVPWNFSDARNYGIEKAVGERIMIVDADEELSQKTLYILEDGILNPKYKNCNTLFVKLHNFYTLRTNEYAEVVQARIFTNTGQPIYQFSIHNKPRVDGPYYFLDNVIFNHYGYVFQKQDLFLQKKERSLPMLEAEYEKNHDDLHILTHIIKTYYACGNHQKVIELGSHWMKLMRKVNFHEGWYAYLEVFVNVLSSYCALKDMKGAEKTMKESQRYSKRLIAMYLIMGQFCLENKKKRKARELFEEAYMLHKQGSTNPYEKLCSTNTNVIIPEILNYLSLMCFEEKDYDKAGRYQNEGIRLNENRLPLRWDLWNDRLCSQNLKIKRNIRKRSA